MKARAVTESEPIPFELALRIRHPSMDPAELSRELGLEPTHTFRAGQMREPRSSASPASVHAESYWLGALDPAGWLADIWPGLSTELPEKRAIKTAAMKNLGMGLALCARALARSHAPLFERIRDEGGQASLLVSLSPVVVDNFSVAPEISQMLGDLGITVEFELAGE
jgi:hypothetical protein